VIANRKMALYGWKLVSILFLALLGGGGAWAQQEDSAPKIGVMVTVTNFAGEAFMKRIRSFVVKDFGRYSDVHIVEDRELADYSLLVLPTQAETSEGHEVGFALFTLVTKPFRGKDFDEFLERGKLDIEKNPGLRPLKIVTSGLDEIQYLGYRAGPPDALGATCGNIVATFDKKCLEPGRQAMAEFQKKWEEFIKKVPKEGKDSKK
jgi:hypothetical protein